MGMSNQIPSSRLVQPGVCTSSTRPASPYEGQAIFETDTDRMLIWNGSTWVVPNAPAQNPTGLELVKTQTFSNVPEVNVDNVFSSIYKDYRVLMTIYSSAATTLRSLQFRYRNSSGTANGSDYYTRGWYNFGTLTNYAPAVQNHWYIGDAFNNAQYPGYFAVDIMSPNEASRTVGIGQAFESYNVYTYNFNNVHATGNIYTGFNLTLNVDNLYGSVSVYGYRR